MWFDHLRATSFAGNMRVENPRGGQEGGTGEREPRRDPPSVWVPCCDWANWPDRRPCWRGCESCEGAPHPSARSIPPFLIRARAQAACARHQEEAWKGHRTAKVAGFLFAWQSAASQAFRFEVISGKSWLQAVQACTGALAASSRASTSRWGSLSPSFLVQMELRNVRYLRNYRGT